MDKITDHFKWSEFSNSSTATKHKIDNSIPEYYRGNIKALCLNVLEPLRKQFGVVRVTSGFRCEKLNTLVGGALNSAHLRGEAADIMPPAGAAQGGRIALMRWFIWMMDNLRFNELIWERKNGTYWIHVSYLADPTKNRQRVVVT